MKIKSKFSLCLLAVALSTLSSGCKDDTPPSNSGFAPRPITKTILLASAQWKLSGMSVSPAMNVGGIPVTDLYPTLDACMKDDSFVFLQDQRLLAFSGKLKCEANEPETVEGIWRFENGETQLVMNLESMEDRFDIKALDQNAAVLGYKTMVDDGTGLKTFEIIMTYTPLD